MATTFQTSPEYHSISDKRSIAWGLSLAVILAVAIIFMMRTISRDDTLIPSATGIGNPAIEKVENSGATEQQRPDTIPPTAPTDSTQPAR